MSWMEPRHFLRAVADSVPSALVPAAELVPGDVLASDPTVYVVWVDHDDDGTWVVWSDGDEGYVDRSVRVIRA